MKKSLLLLICLLFVFPLTVLSQALIVWKKDGTNIRILFDDRPCTKFTNESLQIETTKSILDIPLDKVSRYTFDLDVNGIGSPTSNALSPTIRQAGDKVILFGLPSGMPVAVYSTDGRLLMIQSSDANGQATFNMTRLPKGIYFFKAGALVTFKFTSK